MALRGLEVEKRSRRRVNGFAADLDARRPVDDEHECVLFDLVVPEALPWLEPDQNYPADVVGVEHNRRPASTGRLDLEQVPTLHRERRTLLERRHKHSFDTLS